ncbi:MAG: ANTAR domain-containing protein [Clostridiales bacterium]|nr:ANTAR domain-containing protein [Clostridiales bacterium]
MRGIILAFPEIKTAARVRDALLRHGLAVRGIARDGAAALRMALLEDGGGLIICSSGLPDMTAPILFSNLTDDFDMLILSTGPELDANDYQNEGMYLITLPVISEDLAFYARSLLETRQLPRLGVVSNMNSPIAKDVFSKKAYRSSEEKRKIESAKLVLMRKERMSEAQAHRFLQKESMIRGMKMSSLAEQILRDS